MKKLLALGLVAVIATGALAQSPEENMIGLFFDNTVFNDETTNLVVTNPMFTGYVVLLNPTVASVAAYEVGIQATDPSLAVLTLTGPEGGPTLTNFGSGLNHLCGFSAPVLASPDGMVLAQMGMFYFGANLVEISMGPATPSSFGGEGPGIANGENVDELILCPLTTYMEEGAVWGVVATLNGTGVVATEAHSLSSVKALFN